jgi:lipocalin-like protein
MAVHLMDPGRKKFAAAEPTPEEALLALRSHGSAYFGPYTIHKTEGFVVHRQLGMINPGGGVGTDTVRGYEFVGNNRLILQPPARTINGQKVQSFAHWERVTPLLGSSQ